MTKIKARKEQLEMMVEWYNELDNIQERELEFLRERWKFCVKDQYLLNDGCIRTLHKYLKKYGFKEVIEAIDTATSQYLKYNKEGQINQDSVNTAFYKIGAYAG